MKKEYKFTEEHRRHMSETRKRLFNEGKLVSPNKGKKLSDKYKNKISLAHLGKKLSVEHKLKLSEARKGQRLTEEHKKKISLAHLGKPKLFNRGKNNYWYRKKRPDLILRNKSKNMSLENNPNWLGGISFEPYTKEFNRKFKRLIRKRDNQICMNCLIHREKQKQAFDIHHINYDKKLSIPENCISLCKRCHRLTNYNREHWIKFFQSLLNEKYGYQYSEDHLPIINLEEKNAY